MKETLKKTNSGEIFITDEPYGYANIGLKVETEIGDLYAYPSTDPDYPGICLMFSPKGDDVEIDITYVEVPNNSTTINIYNYEDPYTEDWTRKSAISYKDIKDALEEWGEREMSEIKYQDCPIEPHEMAETLYDMTNDMDFDDYGETREQTLDDLTYVLYKVKDYGYWNKDFELLFNVLSNALFSEQNLKHEFYSEI